MSAAYTLAETLFFWVATLLAVILFITGLKRLSSPATARIGNRYAAAGMLLAIIAAVWRIDGVGWWIILAGVVIGAAVGLFSALNVKMTAMPQMVALFNGAGGGAAACISTAQFFVLAAVALAGGPEVRLLTVVSLIVSAIIGAVSFSGSIIAFLKLQEWMTGRPVTYKGQQVVNALLGAAVCVLALTIIVMSAHVPWTWYIGMLVGALIFGVLFVLPIGGADMPVVISLLNSFTGVAVAITGFELNSPLLIVSGTLVGASGTLLTILMGKAMNRPLTNVLFGAFGATGGMEVGAAASGGAQNVRSATVDDVAVMLGYAHQVIVVPGYGMAVAQAQHSVRELADQLEKKGVAVKYAIHPVAGRMPGHMNVLLAEANVPYNQLYDMDDINPEFPRTDVALIIGANDVTNPAARNVPSSPIYGMPILDVDKAANVIVLKRSMRSGFAGIENPLYEDPKTAMLFGDAKASVDALVAAVKAL
ncbi:MAG TPA: NAD(P)(+) transhydrogenase (Re/Si-specific) subunit beta [Candidatus Baltobacteraceae bacterium]|nr:NAD(P)(+) transhydrogenase (Re/Si-specific) subunit beta [Candidatus Baltobacteraceae bacterium]